MDETGKVSTCLNCPKLEFKGFNEVPYCPVIGNTLTPSTLDMVNGCSAEMRGEKPEEGLDGFCRLEEGNEEDLFSALYEGRIEL